MILTVPKMPNWYYEKKDLKRSPSVLDGLDPEKESRYRREGARFIINVGTKMGLRYDTMATGVVYFHRFYMFHSFKTFPRHVTACCCLFLAGKVEETPKKCKDIIRTAKTFLTESQLAQFGDDPKEEVMTLERILLQTIKFDFQVDHPYVHLLKYAKCLKGDKNKRQNMVQMAWTFINDSLCTTLCLQWEPEVIAIALMYLAGKLSKFEISDWNGRISRHSNWWDMFVEGLTVELLEDICHQVLDLYSTPTPAEPIESPPATPPTKSTRRISQPVSDERSRTKFLPVQVKVEEMSHEPSPAEASASPAGPPAPKPKEPVVGQPIPRLEPGELKRKVTQSETHKDAPESKVPRITEGKAIPTISPKATSSQGSDSQNLSSPETPPSIDKSSKHLDGQRIPVADTGFRSQTPPYPKPMTTMEEPMVQAPTVAPMSSYPPALPIVTTTYTHPYYPPSLDQGVAYQGPSPQVYGQHPMPYQQQQQAPQAPPPVIPPPQAPPPYTEPPVHQYSMPMGVVPPYSTHYPPPRPQPPMNNPPPPPPPPPPSVPPPLPPPGPMRPMPPLPPGMPQRAPPPPPPPHMMHEPAYPPPQDTRGGMRIPPEHMHGPPRNYESERQPPYRGRMDMDYDMSYEPHYTDYDDGYGYHNMHGQDYDVGRRPPPPQRRFPPDHQMHRKPRGPAPPMGHNGPPQHGTPTGIASVRITGSQ